MRALGEHALAHGVSPHEDDSFKITNSTTLLFGFEYYRDVIDEIEEVVSDAALKQMIEKDDKEDINCLLDPNPLQISVGNVDVDVEDVTDEATNVDGTPKPPEVATKIPDSVDAAALKEIEESLARDMAWACEGTQVAGDDVTNADISTTFKSASFDESLQLSNEVAHRFGIDTSYEFICRYRFKQI